MMRRPLRHRLGMEKTKQATTSLRWGTDLPRLNLPRLDNEAGQHGCREVGATRLIFLDSSWYASMFKQLSELGGCGAAVSWKARNFAAGTCLNRSASANMNSSV